MFREHNREYFGTEIGICKYFNRIIKKCVCITTKEIFSSQSLAAKKYGLSNSLLSSCCNGKAKRGGMFNGKPMICEHYICDGDYTGYIEVST
jgi:hypothetical protein